MWWIACNPHPLNPHPPNALVIGRRNYFGTKRSHTRRCSVFLWTLVWIWFKWAFRLMWDWKKKKERKWKYTIAKTRGPPPPNLFLKKYLGYNELLSGVSHLDRFAYNGGFVLNLFAYFTLFTLHFCKVGQNTHPKVTASCLLVTLCIVGQCHHINNNKMSGGLSWGIEEGEFVIDI